MSTPTYDFIMGARIDGLDPAVVGPFIANVAQGAGLDKTPDHDFAARVVRASRAKRSPLHDYFEWDDVKAAVAHRIDQARYVIRCVTVVSASEGITKPTRAFVVVNPEDEPSGWLTVQCAMNDHEYRRLVLDRAKRELIKIRHRYEEYEELGRVFSAIDQLELVEA